MPASHWRKRVVPVVCNAPTLHATLLYILGFSRVDKKSTTTLLEKSKTRVKRATQRTPRPRVESQQSYERAATPTPTRRIRPWHHHRNSSLLDCCLRPLHVRLSRFRTWAERANMRLSGPSELVRLLAPPWDNGIIRGSSLRHSYS